MTQIIKRMPLLGGIFGGRRPVAGGGFWGPRGFGSVTPLF